MTATARRIITRIASSITRTARRAETRTQDRATAREHNRHVITHTHRALRLAAWGFTAREFLTSLGCDEEFIGRYESAFGRSVAKTYRANHGGAEPDRGGRVILRGRMRRVMRYADVADLMAGAASYARTADLVA
jgi:hypothetical protein